MTARKLLSGPVMLGFATYFDGAFGDPSTPRPYAIVRPASVGGILLPFPCPHCEAVRAEAVDPLKRDGYADKDRGFSWCPACQGRYVLDLNGVPLAKSLPAGATHAPAQVDRLAAEPFALPGKVA